MQSAESKRACKERSWAKKLAEAPMRECSCGCGAMIKSVDAYGRPKTCISGHNGRKYDDPKQFKREWNHRNRAARYQAKKRCWRRKKVALINLKGGRCSRCPIEYNGTNAAIFHLHHRDGTDKKYNIGNQLTNRAWAVILLEVEKCDLVCANCHELLHSGEF